MEDSGVIGMNKDNNLRLSDSSSLWLSFLRGLAAQAVVVRHGLSYFGITSKLHVIQNSAVVAFFLLRGVVIPYSTFGKMSANRDPLPPHLVLIVENLDVEGETSHVLSLLLVRHLRFHYALS